MSLSYNVIQNTKGDTVLILASEWNIDSFVFEYYTDYFDVNIQDLHMRTALMKAIQHDSDSMFYHLMDESEKINFALVDDQNREAEPEPQWKL